jgi:hypothetical protein
MMHTMSNIKPHFHKGNVGFWFQFKHQLTYEFGYKLIRSNGGGDKMRSWIPGPMQVTIESELSELFGMEEFSENYELSDYRD